MTPLSTRMVEAAARALSDISDMGWQTASEYQRDAWREQARASLTAALALAEAERAVLAVVPGEMDAFRPAAPMSARAVAAENTRRMGHNACRAATLAGRVWP